MPSDPAKTKAVKAVKAWAVIGQDNEIDPFFIYANRDNARCSAWTTERVIPVLITPIEGTDLKGRESK